MQKPQNMGLDLKCSPKVHELKAYIQFGPIVGVEFFKRKGSCGRPLFCGGML